MKQVRISAVEIERAKDAAAVAGLRLVGLEKRPDGTLRFEFAETASEAHNWRKQLGLPDAA